MGEILYMDTKKPAANIIETVTGIIRNGGVIVYPTDTVYALGADALNPRAVLRVFKIKNRPLTQPLPLAVADLNMAQNLAFLTVEAIKLSHTFWPGALTIVMKKKPVVPSIVSGGKSVGLRVPNHIVSILLLQKLNKPLIATSANKHGMPSPLDASEVMRQIGKEVDLVIDSGEVGGQPSTIIDLTRTPPLILRKGLITREMIEKIIGHIEG